MSKSRRRVVITGLGPITAAGIGKDALLESIQNARPGISPLTRFDSSPFRAKSAAQVQDFNGSDYFPPHRIKRLDLYAQLSVASAILAMQDSGLSMSAETPKYNWGVSFGTALGGISNAETEHAKFIEKGPKAVAKNLALQVFGGSAHANIAIEFNLRGVGITNSNSCASGTTAIGEAFRYIRDGIADVIIAGAAEAPLCPLTFGAFDFIKTMSPLPTEYACCPFDARRAGFVMGEGSASLVLEEFEHAKARGAHIYAEVLGYSLNNDAFHMTSPLPDAAAAIHCMKLALQDAQLPPESIDYINAHASSTQLNDATETLAIHQVFGAHTRKLMVSGTKPFTGHPLGATGAMEAIICALAFEHKIVPPTLCYQTPDPACDLDIVPNTPRSFPLQTILSNSFGFGGINSSLVLRKIT